MYAMDSSGAYAVQDLGETGKEWGDIYLASGKTIYIGGVELPIANFRGLIQGCSVAYEDDDTYIVRTGKIDVDGSFYDVAADIKITDGSLSASSLYAVYIDESLATTTAITSTQIYHSTTLPEWSPGKLGWYYPATVTTPTNVTGVTLYSPVGAGVFSLAYTNSSNTLSWGGGTGVVVSQDADITLEDGSGNSIRVFVDYSALPASNQSDSIIVAYQDQHSDRCIGFFYVDSSGDIIPFSYSNGLYQYRDDQLAREDDGGELAVGNGTVGSVVALTPVAVPDFIKDVIGVWYVRGDTDGATSGYSTITFRRYTNPSAAAYAPNGAGLPGAYGVYRPSNDANYYQEVKFEINGGGFVNMYWYRNITNAVDDMDIITRGFYWSADKE
jgi:hypothetical protein